MVNPSTAVFLWRVRNAHRKLPKAAGPGLSLAAALGWPQKQVWDKTAAADRTPSAFNVPPVGYIVAFHPSAGGLSGTPPAV